MGALEQAHAQPFSLEAACAVQRLFDPHIALHAFTVSFLTGLALYNSATGRCQVDCVPFTVHLRELDRERVERYVRVEQPLDCAGSFKAEGWA